MSVQIVRIQEGKKSVTISQENYERGLTFYFCYNGFQSTGVTLSKTEITMLEMALGELRLKLAEA